MLRKLQKGCWGWVGCVALLLSVTACTGGNREALERSLAADPLLSGSPSPTESPSPQTQRPPDFPAEIPLYPNAQLQTSPESTAESNPNSTLNRWQTDDPINSVQSFYQSQFQDGGWTLVSPPATPSSDGTVNLEAKRDDLVVNVAIRPQGTGTEFRITHRQDVTANPSPSESPTPGSESSTATNSNQIPSQYQTYLQDLAALGIFSSDGNKSLPADFQPNKTITRREFARWLVAANNRFYANNPGKQIRLIPETSQTAFQDIPKSDPDFATIQGLAEAGLIPSPLSGESTTVTFRPDAPLTREQLLLWKVPLDLRAALPSASLDAVKQTWGFQDAGKIDPKALRAVLADFQNGDQSNIRRVYGFTTLFQPKKSVTRGEAAAALWYFGSQGEGVTAKDVSSLPSPSPSPSP